MEKVDGVFLFLILVSASVVIGVTGWLLLGERNYPFLVEAPCDTSSEICFERDCSEPDSCPPNGLGSYRVFSLLARDFPSCSDNSCLSECEKGLIQCEEILCGENEEDTCSTLPEPEPEPAVDLTENESE